MEATQHEFCPREDVAIHLVGGLWESWLVESEGLCLNRELQEEQVVRKLVVRKKTEINVIIGGTEGWLVGFGW